MESASRARGMPPGWVGLAGAGAVVETATAQDPLTRQPATAVLAVAPRVETGWLLGVTWGSGNRTLRRCRQIDRWQLDVDSEQAARTGEPRRAAMRTKTTARVQRDAGSATRTLGAGVLDWRRSRGSCPLRRRRFVRLGEVGLCVLDRRGKLALGLVEQP